MPSLDWRTSLPLVAKRSGSPIKASLLAAAHARDNLRSVFPVSTLPFCSFWARSLINRTTASTSLAFPPTASPSLAKAARTAFALALRTVALSLIASSAVSLRLIVSSERTKFCLVYVSYALAKSLAASAIAFTLAPYFSVAATSFSTDLALRTMIAPLGFKMALRIAAYTCEGIEGLPGAFLVSPVTDANKLSVFSFSVSMALRMASFLLSSLIASETFLGPVSTSAVTSAAVAGFCPCVSVCLV